MKKVILLILISVIIFSCSKEDGKINETNTFIFKFEKSESVNNDVDGYVYYEIPAVRLNQKSIDDKNLIKVEATTKSGEKSYAILQRKDVIANIDQNALLPKTNQLKTNGYWVWGYFFDGVCHVYGQMFYGENGVNLFIPCGIGCVGFPDICPDDDEAFAK